jgi:tetratricopeptide (TPR) repeat protein
MFWEEWARIVPRNLARYVRNDVSSTLPPMGLRMPNVRDELAQASCDGAPRFCLSKKVYDLLLSLEHPINYDLEKPFHDPSVGDERQKIRTPREIMQSPGRGTCLDLSVLFASFCLENGLLPFIVLLEGHALVVVSITHGPEGFGTYDQCPEHNDFDDGLLTDLDKVITWLKDRESCIAIECTGFAVARHALSDKYPEGKHRHDGLMNFQEALAVGLQQIEGAKLNKMQSNLPGTRPFAFALDVVALHGQGLPPYQIQPPYREITETIVDATIKRSNQAYQDPSDQQRQIDFLRKQLGDLMTSLELMKNERPSEQIDAAANHLRQGDSTQVRALLADVEHRDEHFAPDAARHIGALELVDGDAEASINAFRQAADKVGATDTLRRAEYLAAVGEAAFAAAHYQTAEDTYRKALRLSKEALGNEHAKIGKLQNDLGMVLQATGRYQEAVSCYAEALNIATHQSQNDANVATTLNNLGELYRETGQIDDATPRLQKALEIMRELPGNHKMGIATTQNNLGLVYMGQQRFDEAERHLTVARDLRLEELGEDHWLYAQSINNLGHLFHNRANIQGDNEFFSRAVDSYEKALKIDIKYFGEVHPEVGIAKNNIAAVLVDMGRQHDAIPFAESSVRILKKTLGSHHPKFANALLTASSAYMVEDWNKAMDYINRWKEITGVGATKGAAHTDSE